MWIKLLIIPLILLTTLASPAQAEELNFTSYYPAPSGNYYSINLKPQVALPASNCAVGTLYSNASDNSIPYYCIPPGLNPLSTFLPLPGIWTLNTNYIYLTDPSSPASKKVGLGTITPNFKLTLANDGGILADNVSGSSSDLPNSGAGTKLIWYPKKGAFRAGYATPAEWNDGDIGLNSMAMGYRNRAGGPADTIWGGRNNATPVSTVLGYNMIAGGLNNTCSDSYCQILGGENNRAAGNSSASGKDNVAESNTFIGGGQNNLIQGAYGTISGGSYNNLYFADSSGTYATISGGRVNNNWANYSTIAGGNGNVVEAGSHYSTVSGGYNNTGYSDYATVGGGYMNTANGSYGVVSGGSSNQAGPGIYNTVSGGLLNFANCFTGYCSVAGGDNNIASGNYSTILGGMRNNTDGNYAIVPGGGYNNANANYSLAAGRNMSLSNAATKTFFWGHSANPINAVTTPNAFLIYSGRMGIRDIAPAAKLEISDNGSTDDLLAFTSTSVALAGNTFIIKSSGRIGVGQTNPSYPMHFASGAYVDTNGNFMPASSRSYKENISELNLNSAMEAFSKLVPVRYNYINEKAQEYLGFIAEDVPDLVVSKERQGLAPMDIAGVLTKVIAHQQETLQKQKEESGLLLNEVNTLKNRIQILKQMEKLP